MALELQDQFAGMAPAIAPAKLPESRAQIAKNLKIEGGQLRPFRGILDVQGLADNIASLHYLNQSEGWLFSVDERSYVRPFLPADAYGFTYFTDGVKPKYRVEGSSASYDLGLPRPAAPNLSVVDEGDRGEDDLLARNQSYLVVWVDGHGRVGPSGQISASVTVGEGSNVQIDRPALPATDWFITGAVWRIFRSNTGSNTAADYQFVDEVPIATTTYNDQYEPDQLTYVSFSDLWVGPPNDMVGLTLSAGDFLLGFTDNEVFASVPRVPQAWPFSWGFQEQVRGIAVIQGGVLVVTDGSPWLLAGSHPDSMQKVPIESDAVCVSEDSLVDMGGMAIYAGRDGLYAASGTQVRRVTEGFLDEETWQKYEPESIMAFKYEHYYVGFYGDVADGTGFIFDPVRSDFVELEGLPVVTGAYEPWEEKTYVVYDANGLGDLRLGEFDAGDFLTGLWRGRVILTPDRRNYCAMRLRAEDYPVTMRVFTEYGSQEIVVTDNELRKLAAGFKATNWEMEVEFDYPVEMFCIATATGEIV